MANLESSLIAVIGASARLPGAETLESFWEMLQTGRDAISEVSPERWDADAFYDADPAAAGKTYCVRGGFLRGIDEFDAAFFGVEADEARKMDPQQRLALQEAWRTFEDAGYLPCDFQGKNIGVYVGARTGDYHDAILNELEVLDPQTLMGHDSSILSARISHFLNLRGPNLTVNTACSSMGVALHLAGQSLQLGEIDMALVGGVNIMSTPQRFLMHSRSRLLSKRGECRPLDEAADGFVPGEAVGFVLLKKRDEAVADGDRIYGNIRATGVNHGGYREKGISAPNPEAQAALLRSVMEKCGVSAEMIGYVETHGTGTYKGDALEVNALREAYGSGNCAIGSVKANVGHSLTAAVLPGLLKILLTFRYRKLPRQAHFETANALLEIEKSPFRILTETTEWTAGDTPRRAALSAFSYTGTNFHMVLEEEKESPEKPPLPRHPFARDRYWLRGESHADLTLFFARRDDVFQASRARCEMPAVLVKCGGGFQRLGHSIYQIDPSREEDYLRLVEALGPLDGKRVQVVHLWNYECEPLDFIYHGNIERCLHLFECSLATGERALSLFRRSLPSSASLSALYLCHGFQPQNQMAAGLLEEDPGARLKILRLPDRATSTADLSAKIRQALETKSAVERVGAATMPFARLKLKKEGVYLLDIGPEGKRFAEEWERSGAGRLIVLSNYGIPDLERLQLSQVNGVVRLLAPSDRESFQRNVAASLLLDDFTKDFSLDFFLLLRPEASGASRFADGFVEIREQMVAQGRRRGKSLVASLAEFHEIFELGAAQRNSLPEPVRFDHETRFLRIISETLRQEEGNLSLASSIESLDLNSMRIVEVVDRFHRAFKSAMRPSLFYKHKTLGGIFEELKLTPSAITSLEILPPRPDVAPIPCDPARPEPVAIIGMSGRFPKARDLQEFWENLRDGLDCVTAIPPDRWDGENITGWGGFIEDIDKFDPHFFGISIREAELMDPQHRLFLQCVWQAIEDAGYDPAELAGSSTGVYVGVATCDYAGILEAAGQGRQAHSPIGVFYSMLANRVSYLLDLRGPSQPIDTACSSSLVGVNRAVQAIRSGECSQAIVGGVNALLTQPLFAAFGEAGMLSPDGRCKTFDEKANGYVRGEGVGVILLKSLKQALADRDPIYALIRSAAENHGGHVSSLTVPNPLAQAEVLAKAYQEAGIDPRTVGYIEAHGTGTSLGDPIEIDGLKQAFETLNPQPDASRMGWCGLGSVKTNIGHLEAAAGIAGLIKVVLSIRNRTLPGNLHFERLNPYVALENSPFYIVEKTQAWQRAVDDRGEELPLRAGVSSFGFGGVNAHIVLEEFLRDEPKIATAPGRSYPVLLSAKTEERLRECAEQLLGFISARDANVTLPDLAYTLLAGRTPMEARLGLTVDSLETLEAGLKAFVAGDSYPGLYAGSQGRRDRTLAIFAEEEALQDAVARLMREEKWPRLVELWVQGLKVDWKSFSSGENLSRIHLPAYPFARERIWVTSKTSNPRPVGWLQKQWLQAELQPHGRQEAAVLILASPETRKLAQRLLQNFSSGQILDVESSPGHDWKNYSGFIDLAGCGNTAGASLAWIQSLQKWIEQADEGKPLFLAVTRGLESFENSSVNLAGALQAGLFRLLQSEYPSVRSRHMDADSEVEEETLIRQIVAEFFSDDGEAEVCYRRGKRFRACLREINPPESKPVAVFPPDHVLWITGGTRGLGALCASHLVRKYGVKKLVLTGREVLPAREEWTTEQNSKSVAAKIRAIQDLEAQGAEVRVLCADLSDGNALRHFLTEVRQEMGPIGGVLHCAGAVDNENPAFIRKPLATIQSILAPKVAGADLLLECFRDEPLAFMVFFSSVSAIVPSLGAGVSDYAMANAYLDYAAEAAKLTFPITSVQWPSWKETGMGEVKTEAYAQSGFLSLTNSEGLQFLDQLLAAKSGSTLLPAIYSPETWKPEALLRHKPRKSAAQSSALETTRDWLAELFARELKMDLDKLKPDVPFQEYGLDSILLAQVWRQLNRKLEKQLDPSAIFEYPTLERLADWLVRTQDPAALAEAKPSVPTFTAPLGDAKPRSGDIAVVGMSCRFPGAANLNEFWSLLSEGRSAIGVVPEERWKNPEGFVAGLIANITEFDPDYFLLSEADARAMDPQALLALEESLNLFHHAGYTPEEIKGAQIGVYLGARTRHQPASAQLREARNPILALGQNYLAANISRFFDLCGPSLVVDTACSSALVGMHLALLALKSGEIEAAVVGGISLLNDDTAHQLFRQRNLLAPEASFHVFDQRASGVVLGEGIGLVLLKTVESAEASGDRILAVIKGLAINNDGRTAGPATPNLQAQKSVMQTALDRSGLRPGNVEYIETNGSGSEITDLLELKAMEAIYGSAARQSPCLLGSVKPNIGHPLCAEGIASFIKVVLMLEHGRPAPFLSGEKAMTHYDLEASPFSFYRKSAPWAGGLRHAALNCFADGGTNAHVILESRGSHADASIRRLPIAPPPLYRRNLRKPNPWPAAIDFEHPLLRNHTAHGQRLLPGMAYFDLLCQSLRERGISPWELELSNLTIHHPLSAMPGEPARIEILCEGQAGDVRQLRVQGRELYLTAEIRERAPGLFEETLDLDLIRATPNAAPLSEAYDHFRRKGLVHTGSMKADGTIYFTSDGRVLELSLSKEQELDGFLFHPVLMDAAAVGAGSMFANLLEGEDRLFLPLFFGKFRASAPIGDRCFARVRTSSLRRKNELLYSDMEFFDSNGAKVAELTDFAYKLVRHPNLSHSETPAEEKAVVHAGAINGAAGLLQSVIGSKLKRPAAQVNLSAGYYELGLESAMLLDLVAVVGKKLAVSLSPTLLFEYATPAELAAYLETKYPHELRNLKTQEEEKPEAGFEIVEFSLTESDSAVENRETILAELAQSRLALWLEEGTLKVRGRAERLTPALRERISRHRNGIADFLGTRKLLPLSRSQKRYWVLSSLQPERSAYNNPIGMRLRGEVDVQLLKEAFVLLMNSHEVLRSCCPRLGKSPVMLIEPPVSEVSCNVMRLTETDAESREKILLDLAVEESRKPINPAVGPNLRIRVIEASERDVTILLTAHHTVFDGYSYLPVLSELMRLYRALERREDPRKELRQYENYTLREAPAGSNESAQFWKQHLSGAPAFVDLPLDRARSAVNAGHGDVRSLLIDSQSYRAMNGAIQEQRLTLFAFMLSILKCALSSWADQADIVIGTTVQCRDDDNDKWVIGDFTNFIPIRSRLEVGETFWEFVRRVYQSSLLCLQHKNFPFEEIVQMASPAARNINPVYNILVNQLPSITEMDEQLSDDKLDVSVSNNRLLNKSAMLDLRFEWYEEQEGLKLICEYNTDLFNGETIEGLLRRIADCLSTRAYVEDVDALKLIPSASVKKPAAPSPIPAVTRAAHVAADAEALLIQKILELKSIPDLAKMKEVSFFELGLDSFDVANLSADLEQVYPEFVVGEIFKHPTIRTLAAFLNESNRKQNTVASECLINFDLFRV